MSAISRTSTSMTDSGILSKVLTEKFKLSVENVRDVLTARHPDLQFPIHANKKGPDNCYEIVYDSDINPMLHKLAVDKYSVPFSERVAQYYSLYKVQDELNKNMFNYDVDVTPTSIRIVGNHLEY